MSKSQIQYSIHRFPLGWAVSPPQGQEGIPLSLVIDFVSLLSGHVISPSIAHHLKETTYLNPVLVITTQKDSIAWIKEIDESLAGYPPEERWWKGTNVGSSSAALFATLCSPQWKAKATELGKTSTPKDHDDLQRCINLVKDMQWQDKLNQVAQAYPNTNWPEIIKHWDELQSSTPQRQDKIIKEIEAKISTNTK